jgi:YD repeat-containing protein
VTAFAYDRQGNVTERTVKRSNGSATLSVKASFDALGRLLTETLGIGRPRSFVYDKQGNVTAITDPRDAGLFDPDAKNLWFGLHCRSSIRVKSIGVICKGRWISINGRGGTCGNYLSIFTDCE